MDKSHEDYYKIFQTYYDVFWRCHYCPLQFEVLRTILKFHYNIGIHRYITNIYFISIQFSWYGHLNLISLRCNYNITIDMSG